MQQQQAKVPMETPQPHPDLAVVRGTSHRDHEYEDEDEYGENEPVPDLEKDDMMARRTGLFQKNTASKENQSIKQFLPVPGSVKYSIAPVSAMKQLNSRAKYTEKVDNERYVVCLRETLCCCCWTNKDGTMLANVSHTNTNSKDCLIVSDVVSSSSERSSFVQYLIS